ncbi:MAG TPA: sulfotransferase [Myxococcota bacterium]|jgi:hypothetical protein
MAKGATAVVARAGAPQRPLGLRAFDWAGRALRAAGVPFARLDVDGLLARAARRTGLHAFGDARFQEPLRRLVASLESDAALTPFGRIVARRDLGRLLENRLRLHDAFLRHPEIGDGPVERPLFVIGLPRTGTSILHELLAQDPASRVPMSWEVMEPWPPPERASYPSDPRIARVDAHLRGVDRVIPGFRAMHRMGAQLPQECVAITAHEFASLIFHTSYRVPSYQSWLDQADLRPVYAAHRRWLQYLQWRCPAERWVLKSPGHLWALDALLAVYPDARIVQTHRDPVAVLASLVSLIHTLRGLASDAADPSEIGADWASRLAAGLRLASEARDRAGGGSARFLDIRFSDLVGREIEQVRRIYDHFGMELRPEAEARMRRYLAEHPRDQHGAHRYSLGFGGLDEGRLRPRFAEYQRRFQVASEPGASGEALR